MGVFVLNLCKKRSYTLTEIKENGDPLKLYHGY